MDEPELFMGELRGYRAWTPGWDNGVPALRPLYRGKGTAWKPGMQEAHCYPDAVDYELRIDAHEAPGAGCTCGWWAYYTSDGFYKVQLDTQLSAPYRVTGVLRSSGVVEMHAQGFRAQRAELVAIAPARDSGTDWYDRFGMYSHGPTCLCMQCREERNEPEPPSLGALSLRYDVPAFDSFAEMVETFPSTHQDERSTLVGFDPAYYVTISASTGRLSQALTSLSKSIQAVQVVAPSWLIWDEAVEETPPEPEYHFDTDELKETAAIPATDVVKALQAEDCKNKNNKSKEQKSWPISANPSVASKSSRSLTLQPPQSVNRLRPPRQLNQFGNRSRRSK